jgi:hypothetical protein
MRSWRFRSWVSLIRVGPGVGLRTARVDGGGRTVWERSVGPAIGLDSNS